jgi:hypothetical protein
MRREYHDYFHWSLQCSNIQNVVWHFISSFTRRIIRLFSISVMHYPGRVRSAYLNTLFNRHLEPNEVLQSRNQNFLDGTYFLKLAVGYFEYRCRSDWHKEFDDSEQYASLHRWGWLIFALIENGSKTTLEWGIHMVRSWLSELSPISNGLIGEPYTVSERISNLALFFLYYYKWDCSQVILPQDLRHALDEMALFLADRVEYHGESSTNNHIIQNARALIFAGCILGNQRYSELGWAILTESLPSLVTKEGFLREGSSHYHFLFTRWVTEIHFLFSSQFRQKDFYQQFTSIAKQLLEKCLFFLVQDPTTKKWQIPLIGDVSPDCTPAFLLSLPWSRNTRPLGVPTGPRGCTLDGYALLWESDNEAFEDLYYHGSEQANHFPESGWYRVDIGTICIFWHIENQRKKYFPTHSHSDTASCVLFRNGVPILIDPGRPSYECNNEFYEYSGSPASHNTLTVDNIGIAPNQRDRFYSLEYQNVLVEAAGWLFRDEYIFRIFDQGFYGLERGEISHTRTFYISENSIRIEDGFSGNRLHTILTYFHFSSKIMALCCDSGVELRHASGLECLFLVKNSDASFRILNGSHDPMGGWMFPEYGKAIPASTCVVRSQFVFPQKIEYLLSFT